MQTNKDYIKINLRLQRIKDQGITPVTLKSTGDIAEKIIVPKGLSNEGLIMSYKEASFLAYNDRHEQLTIEEYNTTIDRLMNLYGEQTYVKGAIDQAYENAKGTLHYISENIGDYYPNFDIDNLSKKEVVQMLQDVGSKMNELKVLSKAGYKYDNSPEVYLELVSQWYSNHKGE